MKQAERGSEEEEVQQQQQPNKLMDYFFSNRSPLTGRYKRFRADWMVMHPGLAFEDITTIRAMIYTNQPVPKYVYDGSVDSLQIYSVKVVLQGRRGLEWPLHVFGLVAVRDSIDSQRNLIFNIQERDDCQTLTEENPYLVLTGPTRAVGLNGPVNIEAELIVKGAVQSEDQYIILDTEFLPCGLHCFAPLYGAKGSMLQVAFERIPDSVEATIFIRVIHGSWPADFRGHFAASTSVEFEILLIECKGDGKSIREDGNMKHLRHVVSVPQDQHLTVWFQACDEEEPVEVSFKAKLSGRSFGHLQCGPCRVGVLVAWSRIRPMCDDLVSDSLRHLCHS
ncbi:hypothetical protein PVAP13_2NG277100 [Panicum virgatum]|uniref:DUF6598 domain-containing protein n=3 Tax=Panicum virgatum TaxID=38727 RepID=A0A8T0VIJ7_PANVG|nr:hypothetical protein PVAP13_2NG277100 [Panicum virgatum]